MNLKHETAFKIFLLITVFSNNTIDCQNAVLSIHAFLGSNVVEILDSFNLSFVDNQVVLPLFEETELFLHMPKGQIY